MLDLKDLLIRLQGITEEIGDLSPHHGEILAVVLADFTIVCATFHGRPVDEMNVELGKVIIRMYHIAKESNLDDLMGQDIVRMKAEDILRGGDK